VNIVIADDHPMIRSSIIDVMQLSYPHATFVEAGSLSEAEATVTAQSGVELVLLDLMMPGMNGLAGCKGFLDRYPAVPVAIISGSVIENDVDMGRGFGARGYIPKTLKPQAMLDVIHRIINGETYHPFKCSDVPHGEGEAPESTASTERRHRNSLFETLTKRERKVLAGVLQGQSNKEIARNIDVQEVTVKVHLKSVFTKLGVSNRTHAVVHALKHGWDSDAYP